MPTVSYMRLDGSVPAGNRHAIVSKFNRDPSIDVLLLTTKVGGLGLNLTGADIVIFMEHDWNPQMDLQARVVKRCDFLNLKVSFFEYFGKKLSKIFNSIASNGQGPSDWSKENCKCLSTDYKGYC